MKTKKQLEQEKNRIENEVHFYEIQKKKLDRKLKSVLTHLRYAKNDLDRAEKELKKVEQ